MRLLVGGATGLSRAQENDDGNRCQHDSPGGDKEANWLPAPKAAFNLTMRLYGPKSEVLTGKWNPPPVTKVQRLPSVTAQ